MRHPLPWLLLFLHLFTPPPIVETLLELTDKDVEPFSEIVTENGFSLPEKAPELLNALYSWFNNQKKGKSLNEFELPSSANSPMYTVATAVKAKWDNLPAEDSSIKHKYNGAMVLILDEAKEIAAAAAMSSLFYKIVFYMLLHTIHQNWKDDLEKAFTDDQKKKFTALRNGYRKKYPGDIEELDKVEEIINLKPKPKRVSKKEQAQEQAQADQDKITYEDMTPFVDIVTKHYLLPDSAPQLVDDLHTEWDENKNKRTLTNGFQFRSSANSPMHNTVMAMKAKWDSLPQNIPIKHKYNTAVAPILDEAKKTADAAATPAFLFFNVFFYILLRAIRVDLNNTWGMFDDTRKAEFATLRNSYRRYKLADTMEIYEVERAINPVEKRKRDDQSSIIKKVDLPPTAEVKAFLTLLNEEYPLSSILDKDAIVNFRTLGPYVRDQVLENILLHNATPATRQSKEFTWIFPADQAQGKNKSIRLKKVVDGMANMSSLRVLKLIIQVIFIKSHPNTLYKAIGDADSPEKYQNVLFLAIHHYYADDDELKEMLQQIPGLETHLKKEASGTLPSAAQRLYEIAIDHLIPPELNVYVNAARKHYPGKDGINYDLLVMDLFDQVRANIPQEKIEHLALPPPAFKWVPESMSDSLKKMLNDINGEADALEPFVKITLTVFHSVNKYKIQNWVNRTIEDQLSNTSTYNSIALMCAIHGKGKEFEKFRGMKDYARLIPENAIKSLKKTLYKGDAVPKPKNESVSEEVEEEEEDNGQQATQEEKNIFLWFVESMSQNRGGGEGDTQFPKRPRVDKEIEHKC